MVGTFKRYLVIIILSVCLIGTNSAVAISDIPALSIPDNYGSIKDRYNNNYSDLVVVHIQDLHCNYDAQMSIYNIVDKLVKEHNFKLVTVEGSVGRLETAPFSKYPDEGIKEKVTQHFLKRGRVDGSAFAHIMNKSSFAFWGVDDLALYKQNVNAFKSSLAPKSENNALCDNIKSILDKFKQKAYNKRLLQFDKQIQAYKQ